MRTYTLKDKAISITDAELDELITQRDGGKKMPKKAQEYFFINDSGSKEACYWGDGPVSLYHYYQGNYYLSEEDCDTAIAQKEAQNRITKYIWDNNLQLDVTPGILRDYYIEKYYLLWSFEDNYAAADYWCERDVKPSLPYLKSEEDCDQVIENCADDLRLFFTGDN